MNKVAFLDRDGTINVDKGYVHKQEDFVLLPDVIKGLRLLNEKGFLVIIITNQSGIGRGMFTEAEYLEFQEWICHELEKEGVDIAACYYCPHVDEDRCNCRKPNIGMFEMAAREWNIDWEKSCVIGDKIRDLSVCGVKPIKGYLINEQGVDCFIKNICFVKNLYEAAIKVEG